tara:strand:- start:52 stop:270 length:219 start_codon:yes stop_codon:yes gene_type:complete
MSWKNIMKDIQLRDTHLQLQDLSNEFDDIADILKDMAHEEIPKSMDITNPDHIRDVIEALQKIKEMDLFRLR